MKKIKSFLKNFQKYGILFSEKSIIQYNNLKEVKSIMKTEKMSKNDINKKGGKNNMKTEKMSKNDINKKGVENEMEKNKNNKNKNKNKGGKNNMKTAKFELNKRKLLKNGNTRTINFKVEIVPHYGMFYKYTKLPSVKCITLKYYKTIKDVEKNIIDKTNLKLPIETKNVLLGLALFNGYIHVNNIIDYIQKLFF